MIVTRISDILTHKSTWKYYKEYTKTQWYSKEEMEAYRFIKLKKLIEHCYENVPYYTMLMKRMDISPSDFSQTSDISIFPILTKDIIKENYNHFVPINIKRIKGVKLGQTGGTTGNVLFKRNDANSRSSVWGAYNRFYDWMGIKESDKNVIIKGGHTKRQKIKDEIKVHLARAITHTYFLDAYNTAAKNVELLQKLFSQHDISLIRGYSQALFEIAKEIEHQNLSFNVKAISTTSEPLMPEYRSIIGKAFNTQLYDQYGCGEIGSIAFECNEHSGLHVAEERVILEIINGQDIIATDLDNFAMPFIRYEIGDEAEISNSKCTCGREGMIISKIRGRSCDYLISKEGERVHWGVIFHLMWDTKIAVNKNMKKYQLIQQSTDEVLFRYISDELTESEKNIIIDGIRSRLGNVQVHFSQEKEIETTKTGKHRMVISNVPDESINK